MSATPETAANSERTLVLLGDSILDNAPYTHPAPDTTAHLQQILPQWTVVRHARDGGRMHDILPQLNAVSGTPAIAILSVGGNDAVNHIGLLERPSASSPDVLNELLEIADEFEAEYAAAARAVSERSQRTILCTIYEVRLVPARYARLARVPLAVLNDRIVRVAASIGAEVLELRSVCTEDSDFVMQIEPSAAGALKIAHAIAGIVEPHAAETVRATTVWAQPRR